MCVIFRVNIVFPVKYVVLCTHSHPILVRSNISITPDIVGSLFCLNEQKQSKRKRAPTQHKLPIKFGRLVNRIMAADSGGY